MEHYVGCTTYLSMCVLVMRKPNSTNKPIETFSLEKVVPPTFHYRGPNYMRPIYCFRYLGSVYEDSCRVRGVELGGE